MQPSGHQTGSNKQASQSRNEAAQRAAREHHSHDRIVATHKNMAQTCSQTEELLKIASGDARVCTFWIHNQTLDGTGLELLVDEVIQSLQCTAACHALLRSFL